MSFPKADEADVCLLLEGTFPFVSGGVSSWVDQIIRAFPEIRFAIVFIGSRAEDYGEMKLSFRIRLSGKEPQAAPRQHQGICSSKPPA